jgi:hypothetical protein
MKIQKVIFSSSEEYGDFWEPISKIFYEKLGIEPVLIYFGENKLSEQYGKVYYQKYLTYPKIIQLLFARIWFTKLEPNTTWLLGDIDLFPLQKYRFVDLIKDIPDDFHVHLMENRISNPPDLWKIKGPKDGGADLCAHNHVAKGYVFDQNFDLHDTFEDSCKFLYENKYGLGFFSKDWDSESKRYYCCCEQYTTERLRSKLNDVNFQGFYSDHNQHISRLGNALNDRGNLISYYDENLLRNQWYIDFHSIRPYTKYKDTIDSILSIAWEGK